MQDAIDRYFPITPAFFGASQSKNNEMFRKWALKQRTNDEMREDFLGRVTELVEKDFGLRLPALTGLNAEARRRKDAKDRARQAMRWSRIDAMRAVAWALVAFLGAQRLRALRSR